MRYGVGCQTFRDVLIVGRRPALIWAASRADPLQVPSALLALDQVALAANDP